MHCARNRRSRAYSSLRARPARKSASISQLARALSEAIDSIPYAEVTATIAVVLRATRQGLEFGSAFGHCGPGAIFGAQRSVANDPSAGGVAGLVGIEGGVVSGVFNLE